MSTLACAIYTRKSSDEGLDQSFNSLHAQREACEAFVLSQKAQGWRAVAAGYDDGGFSGGKLQRPALTRLLAEVAARRVQIVVVYKVDRLTRSLADFAKLVELFDAHGVSFVSVTQQFNTTTSMGRLTLNVLLSFAQFEREVTGERIRDKIAASKRKGLWMGGVAPIGYRPHERTLVIDQTQADRVREIYRLYLELGCVRRLKAELDRRDWVTPARQTRRPDAAGGRPFSRGHLYRILSNPVYSGQIAHWGKTYPGEHAPIVEIEMWQAVQDRLAAHRRVRRLRTNAVAPSLLAGLVFDDQGHRLTPSHAKKGARRYRYYIGSTAGEERQDGEGCLRVPAQELENAVTQGVASFLADESRVVAALGTQDANATRRALQSARRLAECISTAESNGAGTSPIDALQRLIVRVIVRTTALEIAIRFDPLAESLPTAAHIGHTICVPVQLKRCGMAMRLIVKAPDAAPARRPDPKLVALLAKAHEWFDRLVSGRSNSIEAIAHDEKLTGSHVTRVIHAAFLAPDIVGRIMRADHPTELGTHRLLRMVPLPISWDEQRRLLGLTA